MTKNLILCLAFVLLGSAQVSLGQDYEKRWAAYEAHEKGWDAYEAGDYATALKEWKSIAEQGYAPGQSNIGVLYAEGQGVIQDYKEAAKWQRLAAEQGYVEAQFNLGLMYYRGEGVIQDDVYAHMWYNIAAAAGSEEAIQNRDVMKERMTRAQLAEAQRLARECVAKDYKGC